MNKQIFSWFCTWKDLGLAKNADVPKCTAQKTQHLESNHPLGNANVVKALVSSDVKLYTGPLCCTLHD